MIMKKEEKKGGVVSFSNEKRTGINPSIKKRKCLGRMDPEHMFSFFCERKAKILLQKKPKGIKGLMKGLSRRRGGKSLQLKRGPPSSREEIVTKKKEKMTI